MNSLIFESDLVSSVPDGINDVDHSCYDCNFVLWIPCSFTNIPDIFNALKMQIEIQNRRKPAPNID